MNYFSEEVVYVEQPPDYKVYGHEGKEYRLKKYWIDYLINNAFIKSISEPKLYTKLNEQGQILIAFLYVMVYSLLEINPSIFSKQPWTKSLNWEI